MTCADLDTLAVASKWPSTVLGEDDPISRFCMMFVAHNEDPSLEPEYLAALSAMDEYQPQTSRDALRKFVAIYDCGGHPTDDREKALIAQAKHVLQTKPTRARNTRPLGEWSSWRRKSPSRQVR